MKKMCIYQLILAGLGLVSCSEEIQMPIDMALQSRLSVPVDGKVTKIENGMSTFRISSSNDNVDVLMEKFAKSLAVSLGDEEFRKFLKEEAGKKFDGDFDILFSRSKDNSLSNRKVEDFFTGNGHLNTGELKELMRLNPELNIAIPINIEKWDFNKQAPLVVYVPSDYVENKTPSFLGFDYSGNQYSIDAIEEPSVPVIVVGRNERMGYEANSTQGKSLRTSGNYEKVEYIKCPNLSQIEGWSNGAPEIRFDGVAYSIGSGSSMLAFSNTENVPSRHHAKDGYTLAVWTATQNLFQWHFGTAHGDNYYIQSFEIDNSGSTETSTVSVSHDGVTSSFNLSYKEDDIKMKGELIYKTHASPATLADGNIQFRLENN